MAKKWCEAKRDGFSFIKNCKPPKKHNFCSRGATDNTMVFGTIDSGSIPDGSTTGENGIFARFRFFF